ncbi:glucose-6-phosphate isomerase [Aneurinibacillus uraniidurans]|uniref:glucose-6-phosphate isomerase n=1 Tax=Aneurinibacillus uraniidurans TaxID=2966586 RepID=UPI00234A09E4|nr:glucose-6-phosphate isomerase [Aneurinibacillus sp. B1]WCN39657.1 glucose-6-phosphate isomerase [Aneurinibacillus sp. B1]
MDKKITFDYSGAIPFFSQHELDFSLPQVKQAHEMIHNRTGPGSDYLDWVEWPLTYDWEEYERIKQISTVIREQAEVLLIVGVGGSYLGARAAIEMLCPAFYNQLPREKRKGPEVYFIGHHLSSHYLAQLLEVIQDKNVYVNVISKSGTTLEPALAFRLLRDFMEKKYGKAGARMRIIATTDRKKGVLKQLADLEGYETLTVPDGIGGRYSVLTSVGLLPMAVAGIDIDEVMRGAADGVESYREADLTYNPAYQYAALRQLLYRKGKTIELLASYTPSLQYVAEWWKQLFGESEGKDGKGMFPASIQFTTDLHSIGQYVQEGHRHLIETTLWIEKSATQVTIPSLGDNLDNLHYLSGTTFHEVNEKACKATIQAHVAGGVPNLKVSLPEASPYYFGQMVYFFQKACAMSGYMLGVNPFDQPGVEVYKEEMRNLLNKNQATLNR